MRGQPRVVIGLRKGVKVRCWYPSMMGGTITHTFVSIAEMKRYKKGLNRWQQNRFRWERVR